VPLRVFLSGRASDELDALRRKLTADSQLELVDRAELAEAVVSLPSHLTLPRRSSNRSDERSGSLPRRSSTPSDERRWEPLIESLTTREHDVLALVADGLSNREIAHALAISEHTVKFHLASIFGKLGVSTRTEAVQRGVRLGVLEI
jgi:ATP/maltotriose-dependent transcriptional regulator MalT